MKLERMAEISRKRQIRPGAIKNNIVAWLLILPAMLCIYFFVIRPQVMGIYWSFFDMRGFHVGDFVGLENYKRVISDTMFMSTLWNTCKYVLWSLVIGYALPIVMAIVLNEMVHLRNGMRVMLYFPSVLPSVAVMLLWYLLYYPNAGGLLNMILGKFGIAPYVWLQDPKWTIVYIIISITWNSAGTTMLYYFAALQGVKRELYEAAVIDGAGFFGRLRAVTLPHLSGVMVLFLVNQIIGVFSIMEQVMQMTDGGPNGASMTLGLLAYRYGFVNNKPQFAMATGMIMFLILSVFTILYFVLQKKVEEGGE